MVVAPLSFALLTLHGCCCIFECPSSGCHPSVLEDSSHQIIIRNSNLRRNTFLSYEFRSQNQSNQNRTIVQPAKYQMILATINQLKVTTHHSLLPATTQQPEYHLSQPLVRQGLTAPNPPTIHAGPQQLHNIANHFHNCYTT
jgi:hypothetical protein